MSSPAVLTARSESELVATLAANASKLCVVFIFQLNSATDGAHADLFGRIAAELAGDAVFIKVGTGGPPKTAAHDQLLELATKRGLKTTPSVLLYGANTELKVRACRLRAHSEDTQRGASSPPPRPVPRQQLTVFLTCCAPSSGHRSRSTNCRRRAGALLNRRSRRCARCDSQPSTHGEGMCSGARPRRQLLSLHRSLLLSLRLRRSLQLSLRLHRSLLLSLRLRQSSSHPPHPPWRRTGTCRRLSSSTRRRGDLS